MVTVPSVTLREREILNAVFVEAEVAGLRARPLASRRLLQADEPNVIGESELVLHIAVELVVCNSFEFFCIIVVLHLF